MLRNYIKIAFRSLFKQKLYSFINVFGLALGIACCLLIMLFVRDEWQYDRFHEKSERIYRAAVEEIYGEDEKFFNTVTPIVLAQTLQENFPEISQSTRIGVMNSLVKRGEDAFTERIHIVDADFHEMFDFPIIQGNLGTDPSSVLLTPAIAEKYFGERNPVGQPLAIRVGNDFQDFIVSGIISAPPTYSSIQHEMIIPFAVNSKNIWSERALRSYFNVAVETYLLFPENYEIASITPKIEPMMRQQLGERYQANSYQIHFQPMSDIHLNNAYPAGIEATSDPAYAYILSIIALLVFLIACFNFMTLSLGRSTERAREVGIRKTVGAARLQLMGQFWGETILLSSLAMIIGYGIAQLLLPLFNDLSGKVLTLSIDPTILLAMFLLIILVGMIAGSYPAMVLSAFRPVEVLRGQISTSSSQKQSWFSAASVQKGVVVFQFALSVLLIICTLGISSQLKFLQQKNLGFEKEQVVIIPTNLPRDEGHPLIERFRNEISGHSAISGIASSVFALGEGWMTIGYDADDGSYRGFQMNQVSPEFLEVMNMEMAAGRFFSRDISSDAQSAIVINEALAKAYGWDDPIGKQLPGKFETHEVIGVVKDFNFQSLHSRVNPLVLVLQPRIIMAGASDVGIMVSPNPKMALRIKPGDFSATLDLLKSTWAKVAPNLDFDFYFLDETLNRQYRQEVRLGSIVTSAAMFAILIACLGLFGLATLSAVRRTKEIGVRKVLGASVSGIARMIIADFLKLIVAAVVLAIPAAYYIIDQWLQSFAYRVDIGSSIFILAALISLLIAIFTVGFQAVKAALMDPVKSLRYE